MGKTINKHIRVDENHLKRIEKKATHERGITPVRLMISATLEAIEDREWPHNSANDPTDRADSESEKSELIRSGAFKK